jgi:hypothetical protein
VGRDSNSECRLSEPALPYAIAALADRFAGCCRRSIFGAGYSPRRATFISFGEKKEGKESASTQYHDHIHVCAHDGGHSLARPAGSDSGTRSAGAYPPAVMQRRLQVQPASHTARAESTSTSVKWWALCRSSNRLCITAGGARQQ